jgi:hypothetical protein
MIQNEHYFYVFTHILKFHSKMNIYFVLRNPKTTTTHLTLYYSLRLTIATNLELNCWQFKIFVYCIFWGKVDARIFNAPRIEENQTLPGLRTELRTDLPFPLEKPISSFLHTESPGKVVKLKWSEWTRVKFHPFSVSMHFHLIESFKFKSNPTKLE